MASLNGIKAHQTMAEFLTSLIILISWGNGRMKQVSCHGFVANTESFSIATQIYVRLRRVTGRVVDAIYLAQSQDYARHVIELARATQDAELIHHVERLMAAMQHDAVVLADTPSMQRTESNVTEITPEEIYRAQVSHHYIGALR